MILTIFLALVPDKENEGIVEDAESEDDEYIPIGSQGNLSIFIRPRDGLRKLVFDDGVIILETGNGTLRHVHPSDPELCFSAGAPSGDDWWCKTCKKYCLWGHGKGCHWHGLD